MSQSNGVLVARPVNRLHLALSHAEESAEAEVRHHEHEAHEVLKARQRADQLANRTKDHARAKAAYLKALAAIRELHVRQRADAAAAGGTASEQLLREAFVAAEVETQRQAMRDAMAPIVGSGPAVDRAIDSDVRKVAAEASEDRPAKPMRSGDILPEQD